MQKSSSALAALQDDDLMLGFETNDDAAVYRLSDDTAALLTADFFTPIVDDPYDFGRITAANALSDIYAMGGRPLTAMNLLAFPASLGAEVVGAVLRGGAEKVAEAGALIVGGHTIDDSEPKYGLSVMGTVHPDRVLYNRGARVGDVLVLTKAIGTGIWGTALKRGVYDDDHPQARAAIESMATLNKGAAEAVDELQNNCKCCVSEADAFNDAEMGACECVRACTDITGFGLAGHLHEMMLASGFAATIELDALSLLEGVWDLSAAGIRPGKTSELISWAQNFSWFNADTLNAGLDCWQGIVCDPQTSGGLLLSMSSDAADRYIDLYPQACKVGTVDPLAEEVPAGTVTFV
ncbi:MAG: selenide, water dikinase SelD [Coriobacteriia bacterium]|nr:selenide, water dikinase SelD [Coriobacteriia bacterium]